VGELSCLFGSSGLVISFVPGQRILLPRLIYSLCPPLPPPPNTALIEKGITKRKIQGPHHPYRIETKMPFSFSRNRPNVSIFKKIFCENRLPLPVFRENNSNFCKCKILL
jgi:hypothetical protein